MRKLGDATWEHCPITMNQAASVMEACDRMRDGRAGSVLVTDSIGSRVGIFTGRDAVCRCWHNAATRPRPPCSGHDTKSQNNVARSVEALHLMRAGGFRHIPLVKNGRIVGLVSRGDFHGLQQHHREEERDLWEYLS